MLPQNFNLDRYKDYQKLIVISGSVFISEALSAPLERLKVKLQSVGLQHNEKTVVSGMRAASVLKEVGKKGGIMNLYHGFKPSFDHQLLMNNTRFYSYYLTMDYIFKNKKHEFSYLDVFISSIIATSAGTFFGQPSDITRIKRQRQELGNEKIQKKIEPLFKMKRILQYKSKTGSRLPGIGMNLLVQNVQALSEIFSFFALKNYLTKTQYLESHYAINGVSVLAATALSTFISAPLDLFYTRAVVRALDATDNLWKKDIKVLIKHEGVRGLYKSYLPYFCRTAVFNFSMVTLLELFCSNIKSEDIA